MTDVTGDFPDVRLQITTSDGEAEIPRSEVTHLLNEDATPDDSDSDSEGENDVDIDVPDNMLDPQEVRENVSDRPDVSAEVQEFAENADTPQSIGTASFEDEIAVFGFTTDEIVEGDVDVPSFSASGAKTQDQAEEFMAATLEARERGWMDNLDGELQLPSSNLNLPAGATGTFLPGVRNFAGEKIFDTENRNAKININPEKSQEWTGEQEYIPFGPDTASKMEYVMSHEFGHHQHYNNLIEERGMSVDDIESDEFQSELQSRLSEYEDVIEEDFSAFTANSPFEFAADMFSALSLGADVSDESIEAYERIGGAVP
jgi:hypothetical protein